MPAIRFPTDDAWSRPEASESRDKTGAVGLDDQEGAGAVARGGATAPGRMPLGPGKERRPVAVAEPGESRPGEAILYRSCSWFEPPPWITSDQQGSLELHRRPRALAVRWGHERLVGCRALEPCH